ncbi:MAG: hypothetical protein M3552_19705 [Planctomycetota bacterium]|nr:hypothetical protein [Planctomycetaceae bacterium]MDQ3332843.1 hypothetical protein [Planctomycetota bacterium]
MRNRVYKTVLGIALALMILLAPIAMIRVEQWEYTNAAGLPLMGTYGYRLIGMGPPAIEPDSNAVRIIGHGEGWFGLFRFDVDRPYPAK